MEENMKATLKIINYMDLVRFITLMAIFIMDNTIRIKNKDMENLFLIKIINIQDNFQMGIWKERENYIKEKK